MRDNQQVGEPLQVRLAAAPAEVQEAAPGPPDENGPHIMPLRPIKLQPLSPNTPIL